MPQHSRKLLLLLALCWVVPASASQLPAAYKQLKEWPGCPVARAKMIAEAKAAQSKSKATRTVIFVARNDAIGEGPMFGASRAFQP